VSEDLLSQLIGAAENVLEDGLSDDQLLEFAEGYYRVVESFVESGLSVPESKAGLVLTLHEDVIRAVSIASGRSGGSGHRRSAVKAYIAAFGPRLREDRRS
jgi:hypothetical protein